MKISLLLNIKTVLTLIAITIFIGGVLLAITLRGSLTKTLVVENTRGQPIFLKPTGKYYSLMESNPLIEGVFTEEIDKPIGIRRNLNVTIEDRIIVIKSRFNLTGIEEFFRVWFFTHVDLNQYPRICILLHVNRTIAIHVRVTGLRSSNGSIEVHHIWLDPALGGIYRNIGTGELRCANVADLFYSLTGFKNLVVTEVVIKVVDRYIDTGSFELRLIELMFTSSFIEAGYGESSRVILIKIKPTVNIEEWDLTNIRIYYRIKGLSRGEYSVFSIYWKNRIPLIGKSYMHILEIEEKYVATTIYYSSLKPYGYLQELSNITLSDFGELCIVILANTDIDLLNIDHILLFFEKTPYIYPSIYRVDTAKAEFMLITFVFLIYILPVIILVLTRFVLIKHNTVSIRVVALLIALAFITRVPLLLFTGHSFDMEIWKTHARTYYEDGRAYFEAWPTTPIYYYILILFYSYYALMRTLGFQDYRFMAHTFYVTEGFFIKLPFVVADICIFYAILKILNATGCGRTSSIDVNSKSLLYASLFLFNPLSILVSSAWGMYDPLALCFSLWSLYYFYVKRKIWVATLLGILAGLTKPFGFITLVPVVISNIRNREYRNIFLLILLSIPLIVLTYLPMLQGEVYRAYRFHFIERIFFVDSSVVSWRGLGLYNFSTLAYPLLYIVVLMVVTLWFSYRGFENVVRFTEFASILFITHYLMFRVVYVQHTLWLLPFIIMFSFFKGIGVKIKSLLIGIASVIYVWSAATPGYLITGVPCLWSSFLSLKGAAWGYLASLASSVISITLSTKIVSSKWLEPASDLLLVLIYVTTYMVGYFV